jgi:hypothetical protein
MKTKKAINLGEAINEQIAASNIATQKRGNAESFSNARSRNVAQPLDKKLNACSITRRHYGEKLNDCAISADTPFAKYIYMFS